MVDDLAARSRQIVGLATIGTPHLGYPYLPIDPLKKCSNQVQDMDSFLMNGGSLESNAVLRSQFLRDLRQAWDRSQLGDKFFVAGGRACSTQTRSNGTSTNGCRANNPYSDGVVCDDSASLVYPDSNLWPTYQYYDSQQMFRHASDIGFWGGNVLCPTGSNTQNIVDPDTSTDLFTELERFLRAL